VTGGKIGWNIVCSISSGEAKNFGKDELPPHDVRYGRADEFMEVCNKLWNSWDDGALLMDGDKGIFADPNKINKINHVGDHFSVQGPLTVAPMPQGRPYLFQAGASERGRKFAVDHADCIFAIGTSSEQMKGFVDDMKSRADNAGRDPESIRILWSAQPIVAETSNEARLRLQEIRERIPLEASLALMSGHFNIDLSQFDVDTPVNQLKNLNVTGTQGMFEAYTSSKPEITLREIAGSYLSSSDESPFAGTGKEVADNMIQMLNEVGGDGFQLTPSYYAPKFYEDIVETLIPALQDRKAFRQDYSGDTLRDYMEN
jgi:FMN-dependent oxidoreductase (nitrilotriacetate monooxygenase family)